MNNPHNQATNPEWVAPTHAILGPSGDVMVIGFRQSVDRIQLGQNYRITGSVSAVVPYGALVPSATGDILLHDAGEHRDLDCGDRTPPSDSEKFWMTDQLFCSGHTVLADGSIFAAGGYRGSYNWDENDLAKLGLPTGEPVMADVSFGGGVPFCQKWDWSITDGAWTPFETYFQGIGDPLLTSTGATPVSKTEWYACSPEPVSGRGMFWGNERYYPTATTMTDGQVLVTGGQVFLNVETATSISPLYFPAAFSSFNTSIELYNPSMIIGGSEVLSRSTNDTTSSEPTAPSEVFNPDYSHVFVLPEPIVAGGDLRDVLILGDEGLPLGYSVLTDSDPARGTFYTGWPVRPFATPSTPATTRVNNGASTVMLPIRLSGAGGVVNDFGYRNGAVLCAGGYIVSNGQVVPRARLDAFDPVGGTWFASADLVKGRHHPMTVLLPDGTISVLGGHVKEDPQAQPSPPPPELRRAEYVDVRTNPGALTLSYGTYPDPVGMTGESRGYHAVALLRPDGSIFVGGGREGGKTSLPAERSDFRILSPPYMQGPRPEILAIGDRDLKRQGVSGSRPTTTSLSIYVPTHDAPSEAVMMTLGAMTHSYDMNQRSVEVAITDLVDGNEPGNYSFTITAPPQQWTPPGYHMLFVLDQSKVPSPAVIVHLQ